jgi:site-specific DNA recombinase
LRPSCQAIIHEDLWLAVQAKLDGGGPGSPATPKKGEAALLKGLLFDDAGCAMQPIHANRRGRRYRYYVNSARVHGETRPIGSLPRIGAPTLERLVVSEVAGRLAPSWRGSEPVDARVAAALTRVTLGAEAVVLELTPQACRAEDGAPDDESLRVVVPIRLKHRQGASILAPAGYAMPMAPRLDRTLVKAVSLARDWRRRLESGEAPSTSELAARLDLCKRHTSRILPLGYLAPDLIEMILEGRQPPALSLQALTTHPLPLAWADQRRLVAGFA